MTPRTTDPVLTLPVDGGLIERLEKATEPDRELDIDIHWLCNRSAALHSYNNAKLGLPIRMEDAPEILAGGLGRAGVKAQCPHYTSSIDAALTLKPDWVKGYEIIGFDNGGFQVSIGDEMGEHSTAPIAIVIASLRTRSAA